MHYSARVKVNHTAPANAEPLTVTGATAHKTLRLAGFVPMTKSLVDLHACGRLGVFAAPGPQGLDVAAAQGLGLAHCS